eukprot:6302779-Prymnesium_polylepis.2
MVMGVGGDHGGGSAGGRKEAEPTLREIPDAGGGSEGQDSGGPGEGSKFAGSLQWCARHGEAARNTGECERREEGRRRSRIRGVISRSTI